MCSLVDTYDGFATSIIYIVLKLPLEALEEYVRFATSIIYIVLKLSV